jgi:hypothetical protein
MHTTHTGTSEVAIFSRAFEPDRATLSAVARAILALGIAPADQDRMRRLSARAREGIL